MLHKKRTPCQLIKQWLSCPTQAFDCKQHYLNDFRAQNIARVSQPERFNECYNKRNNTDKARDKIQYAAYTIFILKQYIQHNETWVYTEHQQSYVTEVDLTSRDLRRPTQQRSIRLCSVTCFSPDFIRYCYRYRLKIDSSLNKSLQNF